eukprot:TRINITY_DN32930_c0_g1_i1.p1 TRINITY_DN32930_c0_g1~~TRINITY_DN32930_c0_g1_i1.p1  ORF type:complete len:228 (-),score=37.84 TRINITY_DN32930_c0_g1_i1:133-816(-)
MSLLLPSSGNDMLLPSSGNDPDNSGNNSRVGSDTASGPGSELPRIKSSFRLCVLGLGLIAAAEFGAGFQSLALTDACTALGGLLLLRHDIGAFARGLFPLAILIALNLVSEVTALLHLLQGPAGPANFFSSQCYVQMHQISKEDVHGHINFCSWHTVFGHLALCCSIWLQFRCLRCAWRMAKSMQECLLAGMPLLDLEGGANPSLTLDEPVETGYVPYSGKAYHLGD